MKFNLFAKKEVSLKDRLSYRFKGAVDKTKSALSLMPPATSGAVIANLGFLAVVGALNPAVALATIVGATAVDLTRMAIDLSHLEFKPQEKAETATTKAAAPKPATTA